MIQSVCERAIGLEGEKIFTQGVTSDVLRKSRSSVSAGQHFAKKELAGMGNENAAVITNVEWQDTEGRRLQ